MTLPASAPVLTPRDVTGGQAAWLTVADLAAYTTHPIDETDAWAVAVVEAAEWYVEGRRPDVDYLAVPGDIRAGASMLAGRWYSRRNSPNGIAGSSFDTGTYVPRTDRDIEMLLGLRQPRIG